ncbi:MAG TPA: alkyl hydroperoxide reductase subunit F, partial [Kofleriaceae bacterium]
AYLGKLVHPIELVVAFDASPAADELRELIAEIVSLSPNISTREETGEVRRPSFAIARAGEQPRLRFAGVPLGHEFTSLVLALLHSSGHPPRISDETAAAIRALPDDLEVETFVSLSCHNCPDVVQAFNIISALNPRIRATMIDGAVFPDEIEARGIKAVPIAFVNGTYFGSGRMELEEILGKLDAGAADRAAAKLSDKAPYDVLVVGGGPAGASAAIYAARKGLRTAIVAERFGGQVGDTLGIENLISVVYTEGPQLVSALETHVKQWGVEVITLQRAAQLVPGAPHELRLENGAALKSRTIVLAPGAKWKELGIPGESEYRTKGVAFCPHCDGPLFKGKRIAVIGGGNSGVEAAIDLAGVVGHVTLLEFAPELKADAVLQAKLRSLANVEILVNAQTSEITGDGKTVDGLWYVDRYIGERKRLDVAGVFVQIGLLPSTRWLEGAVALSKFGEIEIDARGATSVPGIFAAGDATTTPFKQIVIALGDGARASLAAFEHMIREGAATTEGSRSSVAA